MTYFPPTGSVVAFQSDPTKLVGTVSVVGTFNSSIQVVGTMPPQSVSGVGTFNINPVGNGSIISTLVNSSVTALQGTNPWNVGNSSVTLMPGGNAIGSVTALQGTNPWAVQLTSGSIATTVGNSSVQLVGGTAMIGSVTAYQGAKPWDISGSVVAFLGNSTNASIITVGGTSGPSSVQLLGGNNVIGSVTALQGTNPWITGLTSGSIFAYQAAGSIMAVSATVNTGNSSVQLVGGTAMIGSVTAYQGANPWVTVGSVQGTVSVLGTVPVTQSGTWAVSMVGIGNASVYLIPGVGVLGSVAALQGTQPWLVQVVTSVATRATPASVQLLGGTNAIGSVAVLQGTNPWVIGNTSVLLLPGLNVIGSVAVLQGTNPWGMSTNNTSVLSINELTRNDKVASFLGVDLTSRYAMSDAEGRTVTMPFAPFASSIFGHASTASAADAASVVVLVAAGTGLKNYVTDWNVFNTGANTTMVTFTEGGASILGKTIVPAGGGSNMPGLNQPLKNQKSGQPINMVVSIASANVHVVMSGFTAP